MKHPRDVGCGRMARSPRTDTQIRPVCKCGREMTPKMHYEYKAKGSKSLKGQRSLL